MATSITGWASATYIGQAWTTKAWSKEGKTLKGNFFSLQLFLQFLCPSPRPLIRTNVLLWVWVYLSIQEAEDTVRKSRHTISTWLTLDKVPNLIISFLDRYPMDVRTLPKIDSQFFLINGAFVYFHMEALLLPMRSTASRNEDCMKKKADRWLLLSLPRGTHVRSRIINWVNSASLHFSCHKRSTYPAWWHEKGIKMDEPLATPSVLYMYHSKENTFYSLYCTCAVCALYLQ